MTLKSINAATAKQWLDNGEAVLIDVREPAEYAAESISGATLIPLSTVCRSALPNAQGKKLIIHCLKGGRGGKACEKLLAEDATLEVYNLEGGISAWSASGFPTNLSSDTFLPLDRQVQLTIGLMLVIGSVVGFFLTPILFILTGIIGVGLTIAGLSGFCGLAHLMAKMPWNQKKTNFCMTKPR